MTTNPALSPLQFLAGAWDMELSGAAFLPDPDASVHGPVTFEWIEQGAALVMRMGGGETPTATWIIGRDESESDYCVLYTDDRRVSRVRPSSRSGSTPRSVPARPRSPAVGRSLPMAARHGSTISWSTTAALHRADAAVTGNEQMCQAPAAQVRDLSTGLTPADDRTRSLAGADIAVKHSSELESQVRALVGETNLEIVTR